MHGLGWRNINQPYHEEIAVAGNITQRYDRPSKILAHLWRVYVATAFSGSGDAACQAAIPPTSTVFLSDGHSAGKSWAAATAAFAWNKTGHDRQGRAGASHASSRRT